MISLQSWLSGPAVRTHLGDGCSREVNRRAVRNSGLISTAHLFRTGLKRKYHMSRRAEGGSRPRRMFFCFRSARSAPSSKAGPGNHNVLPVLVARKLGPSLRQIADCCRCETSEEASRALRCDDRSSSLDHTEPLQRRIHLDPRLRTSLASVKSGVRNADEAPP